MNGAEVVKRFCPFVFLAKIENALIRKNFFLYLFHHIAAGKTAAAAN
jgi:hypothetical protein